MKRWKWICMVAGLLFLGVAGLSWFLLPRFYAEDRADSWTYRSPTYGFRMKLPSSDWVEFNMPKTDAAFHNRKHKVLASVLVQKGPAETFQKSLRNWRDHLEKSRDELLSKPAFTEGATASGNAYAICTVEAKSEKGGKVLVGRSFVWCKDKALIVSILMEGPLTMQSELGKTSENDFYQNAINTMSLSIE